MSLEKLYKNYINKFWGSWHVHVVFLHLYIVHDTNLQEWEQFF